MNMKHQTMGTFISDLRKEKGLTQKQLAQQLNLTDKAISKWERELGCPDITTLPRLAEVLGVSVSELIECNRAQAPVPEADTLVHTTLLYSEKTTKARGRRVRSLIFFIVTISLLIGAIVCSICDLAISAEFTWSVYPLSSIALVWLVLAPLLCFEQHAVAGALGMCTVLIFPFLAVLNYASGGHWFWALGVPIAASSLAYVWIGFWLFTRKKRNAWYASAILCVLAAPLTLVTNMVSALFAGDPLFRPWDAITVLFTLAIAFVLFSFGWRSAKRS